MPEGFAVRRDDRLGANTAIFSLVGAVLLHPLLVAELNRLVTFSKQ